MIGASGLQMFGVGVLRLPPHLRAFGRGTPLGYILDAYKYLIGLEKEALTVAEETHDVVTADMLTGYIAEQEKMVWMLVAFSKKNCNR